MPRAVKLTLKKDGSTELYHFYKDIYSKHTAKELGITQAALYNAIADKKGNGVFENKKIKVEPTELLDWE